MAGLTDLIEALTILRKYGDPDYPTYCEHDEMVICGIDPELVSEEDKKRLGELGFHITDQQGDAYFYSFRFGSV